MEMTFLNEDALTGGRALTLRTWVGECIWGPSVISVLRYIQEAR